MAATAYRPGSALAASPAEIARRNGISPALATSREARAAEPAPGPPPALRGAVKVEAFPERSKYPFREIARDGGIWRLDPATWKVSPGAIAQASRKWADSHGLAVKVITDDGMVYVQFKAGE
jgi:hypothetical protein